MITTFNTAVTETASEILGKHRQKRKPWITAEPVSGACRSDILPTELHSHPSTCAKPCTLSAYKVWPRYRIGCLVPRFKAKTSSNPCIEDDPLMEFVCLCLLAGQVRVTVGGSTLCCYVPCLSSGVISLCLLIACTSGCACQTHRHFEIKVGMFCQLPW